MKGDKVAILLTFDSVLQRMFLQICLYLKADASNPSIFLKFPEKSISMLDSYAIDPCDLIQEQQQQQQKAVLFF